MRAVPDALGFDVSRETLEALHQYESLIRKWSKTINLVAASQLDDLWARHIWDSAQLWPSIAGAHHHVDVGSGGGLPGLVLAILARQKATDMKIALIESDIRKAVFLRTVARDLSLNVQVHDKRYEFVPPQVSDTLSARAVASLDGLLSAAERHLKPAGHAVFPKGATWQDEVAAAQRNWAFHLDAIPSISDPNAAILIIKDIRRV